MEIFSPSRGEDFLQIMGVGARGFFTNNGSTGETILQIMGQINNDLKYFLLQYIEGGFSFTIKKFF